MSGSAAPILIHLIRHGAPERPGRLLGRTDHPATPAGIAHCVAAASTLQPAAIVTSDLIRATACATAIAAPHALLPVRDPRWRELDFGAWDDRDPAAVDPEAYARFWQDPDGCPPPGGERWSALVARVADAIATIEDRTLVVTHGGAMRAALAATCGFDARQVWAFDLPYAAILTLRLWRDPPPGAAQIVALRR